MILSRYMRAVVSLAAALVLASGPVRAQEQPGHPAEAAPADEFAKQPTWSAPTVLSVREQVFKFLDDRKADDAARHQAEALWPTDPAPATAAPEKESAAKDIPAGDSKNPALEQKPATAAVAKSITGGELLERVVKTIALVDAPTRDLLAICAKPRAVGPPPKFPWLTEEKTPPLVRNNLRLWFGRWLAQEQMYDDSLDQIATLEPTDVADPASLLFFQAIDHHWLLHKEPGLKSISKLLERKKEIPRRYAQLAQLMETDLGALKDESLDHIARRMRDTERRLDLGHAGKKVRGVEDGIIASLDKLIEDMEKQQQSSSSSSSKMGPGGKQSSAPAPDSAPLQGKGPGNIDAKQIGHQANWGDLPPKDRQEVLQAIGKEFPSHFRDVIEQYFKKAAEGREP